MTNSYIPQAGNEQVLLEQLAEERRRRQHYADCIRILAISKGIPPSQFLYDEDC